MAWQCDTEAGEVIGLNAGTASDAAAHYIRSLIFAGILEPGDRLPTERELADQLSLNRVTLRIAKKSPPWPPRDERRTTSTVWTWPWQTSD